MYDVIWNFCLFLSWGKTGMDDTAKYSSFDDTGIESDDNGGIYVVIIC